jgi:thiol-disulfide isomerase/thioredoxin
MLTVRNQLARRWIITALVAGMGGLYLLGTDRLALGQVTTTEPTAAADGAATTQPAGRTADNVMADLHANSELLGQIIGDIKTLGDEATRKAVAPRAIPILKKMMAEFDEMQTLQPEAKADIQPAQDQFLAFSSILGDADATAKLAEMAASKDADVSLRGQSGQLLARWIAAGKDTAAQGQIVDDLEKLDKAHTDSIPLTSLTAMFSESAVSPDLKIRLQALVTDTMKNDAASQMKEEIAADQKLKALENKPLAIAGKQVDGKDFTTADWKGKVVLVDFWATWCGPCVAELPRVKKVYADYHNKGLEILGVSNDNDVQALKDFVVKDEMPWPQLFDVMAASQGQWNPITTGFGINGIPTMFLIDKKGVLRTVDARENMDEMIPKLLAE